jgi:hypothetical protein
MLLFEIIKIGKFVKVHGNFIFLKCPVRITGGQRKGKNYKFLPFLLQMTILSAL